MKLKDKVAIITGGAMGNGLGIVKVFLKYGAKVVILDYADTLNDVVTDFQNRGYDVTGYKVDIRNKGAIKTAIDKVAAQYGSIDVLVNNAGVCKLERFEDMDDELRDFHFDINIKGSWNVTKICLPYMKNRNAAIVNLSSVTGPMVADPGEVAYAATKGANLGFTKALARELVDYGIRVNAIMPGYIRTPLIDTMAVETCPEDPESVVNSIASAIPMGRIDLVVAVLGAWILSFVWIHKEFKLNLKNIEKRGIKN
jgi:NAD(P)-dependent dehydrogenase (short-subunit alcohol dehydrogenase family)